jgi:hypothetical protein
LISININIKVYRAIIFAFVVFGCETWSLTWREERRLKMFEDRMLRNIFGLKRDEIIWRWRKLYNEELNDLYCSPNIVRVLNWRRMRWAGHVARTGREYHLEDPDVDGRIILRWIFKKWDVEAWTGSNWLRVRTGGRNLWMR